MIVKPAEVERLIASPPPEARLYLFFGPDAGQAQDLAVQLEARLGGERNDLSPGVIADRPGALADEASAIALFSGRQTLRLSPATNDHAQAVALLLAIPAIEHTTILTAGDLKPTSALRKIAEAHPLARACACYPPTSADFARLVQGVARAAGLDPEPVALALLASAVGGERGVLRQEIAKIAVYLNATPENRQPLTAADWHAVGAGEGAADIDPLVDAVAGRKPAEVARCLRALAADGQRGIPLLRAVGRRFAQLAEARAAVDGGVSAETAIAAFRPPLFWKAKPGFLVQLKAWRGEELAAASHALLAAERGIKAAASAGDLVGDGCLLGIAAER